MAAITLLDGAIGQELVHRSGKAPTSLWSTQVMMDSPDLVSGLHRDYIAAGARVVTTNSYALHRNRLAHVGQEGRLPALVSTAMEQAAKARDKAREDGRSVRIAGSLGPFLASYRPDLTPDVAEAAAGFAELAAMMAGHVDLLLAETVCSLQEAEGILQGTAGAGVPRWIAFSTMDEDGTRLRSGEALGDIAQLLKRHPVQAVLLNCTRPESIAEGLPLIAGLGLPFGAYANGFTHIADGFLEDAPTVDALSARQDLSPEAYADFALGWIDLGATIIGGCCEVGPAHITRLAERIRAAGHEIV